MYRPREPLESDCCGSGCNPCIFDVYKQKLKLYESAVSENKTLQGVDQGISQFEYTTFRLLYQFDLCDSHKLLVFKNTSTQTRLWWNPGDHFLYKYIGEKSYTRAYTPLKLFNIVDNKSFDFMVIVKNYFNNSASYNLCSLDIGADTLWRGPYGCYKLIANQYKRIIMVSQGTGIVPFYSIIKQIIDNEDNFTNVILLYCCRSKNQILLRQELHEFNSYWNFKYRVFLSDSECGFNIKLYYKEPIENHKLCTEDIKQYKEFTSADQILLCGSLNFNNHFKSVFVEQGTEENNIFVF